MLTIQKKEHLVQILADGRHCPEEPGFDQQGHWWRVALQSGNLVRKKGISSYNGGVAWK